MVLSSGYGQRRLHQCSSAAIKNQKATWSTGLFQTSTAGVSAKFKNDLMIPDPSLFEFESKTPQNDKIRFPNVAECAAHLKLLQAFYHIYVKVSSSTALDAVLGIKAESRTVYRKKYINSRQYKREKVKIRDDTFEERQKAKWNLYLVLAAARFLAWVESVEKLDESVASQAMSLHLPPLDVLMVWHALLLNPSWFRSFEGRRPKRLYDTPFPWEAIHEAIDADKRDYPYRLPDAADVWFTENARLEPYLFEALIKEDRPRKIKQLLKSHGAPRPNNAPLGMTVDDIDALLNKPDILNDIEINFLECCRDAIGTDTIITKLIEAVQRQASFVNKMEKQLWIRSPAVKGTLLRAVDRYSKFVKLFKLYPNTILVPTLDIDLVWHTHQCSPSNYDEGMMKVAGRLIDHDDKIGEGVLNPGFARTKDLFRIRFGQEYQVCHCWDCEALLSAATSHNTETRPDTKAIARRICEEVTYYRAVEMAKRNGEI
ncbi:hypothetical protein V494_04309 [Pseudogymnoascus sp. VKM F-4513 (FW-928)]|nr:hypothetical protein V494_04309 [Pseudogymnoascus sp. VKM F-4513 (FW-928)]